MKSQLAWYTIQNLERSFHQSAHGDRRNNRWNGFWHWAIARLALSSEPHVWQSQNGKDSSLWSAYDPKTGRSVHNLPASELRVWLEERHYQTLLG